MQLLSDLSVRMADGLMHTVDTGTCLLSKISQLQTRTTESARSPEMLHKLSHMQEAGMQILAALRQVSLGFPKSFKIFSVNNFTYNLTISPVQKQ